MPKLTAVQFEVIERELEKGPRAHGYPTELWTLARVAEVIEATTGIAYHPGTSGRSCVKSSTGAGNVRHAGPSSATRRRSPAGSPRTGPG